VRDHAVPHELEQHRRDASLDHVTARHRHHGAPPRGIGHRIDDAAEVACGKDVWERAQERAERAICAGRRSELFGAYLVRSVRDGNGADP
jgi:hypothetical protein